MLTRFLFVVMLAGLTVPQMTAAQCSHARYPQKNVTMTPRTGDYDILHYQLALEVDPETESLTGQMTLTAISTVANLSQIDLDLHPAMTVDHVIDAANQSPLEFTHQDDQLLIVLPAPLGEGDSIQIAIHYSGSPEEGWHWGNIIYSLNFHESAQGWMPCNDRPDDKATFHLECTVPAGLTTAANGKLIEVIDNGDGTETHFWQENYPIATYLIVIHIGEYAVLTDTYPTETDTMDVFYYVRPSEVGPAEESFSSFIDMMTIYANRFGEYPFLTEKMAVATAPIIFAGMEHQTCYTLNPAFLSDQSVICHELSHQWWGDAVTPLEWADIWLNEGFATYSEAIYFDDADITPLPDYMNTLTAAFNDEYPIYNHPDFFPTYVYDKGAWVQHMLRGVMGDEAFFAAQQDYFQTYRDGNASTERYREICEAHYEDDLSWFFDQWVYGAGHPEYKIEWTQIPTAYYEFRTEVRVHQTQPDSSVFQMPLPFRMIARPYPEEDFYDITRFNDQRDQVFLLDTDCCEDSLIFDPENWLLKRNVEIEYKPKFTIEHIIIDDSEGGDGDGAPEAGETFILHIQLKNNFRDDDRVIGRIESEDDAFEFESGYYAQLDWGEILTDSLAWVNTTISIMADTEPHLGIIDLDIGDRRSTLDISLFLGAADILLVDDDGGADFERYFLSELDSLHQFVEHWDTHLRGAPNANRLADYETVIWFTGNQNTETLTAADQAALIDFLEGGGKLFLTGEDIDEDLMVNGNGETFFTDYLRAELITDDRQIPPYMPGVAGDPIGNGLTLRIRGDGGADNQDSPGEIAPLDENTFGSFAYPAGDFSALHYADGARRVVYFAFGLEAITQTNQNFASRKMVLQRVLEYLSGTSTVLPEQTTITVPQRVQLYQNVPNPFNPQTVIRFDLAQPAPVKLIIYDVRGQVVRTLVDRPFEAGSYSVLWDATTNSGVEVSSGIYLYRLETPTATLIHRMTLLR